MWRLTQCVCHLVLMCFCPLIPRWEKENVTFQTCEVITSVSGAIMLISNSDDPVYNSLFQSVFFYFKGNLHLLLLSFFFSCWLDVPQFLAASGWGFCIHNQSYVAERTLLWIAFNGIQSQALKKKTSFRVVLSSCRPEVLKLAMLNKRIHHFNIVYIWEKEYGEA